jgi:hypothetical protein
LPIALLPAAAPDAEQYRAADRQNSFVDEHFSFSRRTFGVKKPFYFDLRRLSATPSSSHQPSAG